MTPLRYLSVCSGIEAASVAWGPLGWEAVGFAEIDPFCRAVLRHHYPTVPNYGDFTEIGADDVGPVDLLVGGTPCQDFSVAGLRAGLGGDRGQLTVEFLRLAGRLRPRWVVWENVPGVLSSDGGRAMGTFLWELGELGYGWAYRVLDAQFAGVPQRRRRVFLVGHLGDQARAAAVLFERHSLSGHPAPRRQTRERPPAGAEDGARDGEPFQFDLAQITSAANPVRCAPGLPASTLNAKGQHHVAAHALTAHQQRLDGPVETFVTHALRADGFDAGEDGTGRGTPLVAQVLSNDSTWSGDFGVQSGVSVPVKDGNGTVPAVAYGLRRDLHRSGEAKTPSDDGHGNLRLRDAGFNVYEETAPTLECQGPHAVAFSCKDHGADAGDTAPTLRAMTHDASHANAGGQVAVAFDWQAGHGNDDSFRGKSRQYVVRKGDDTGALGAQKRDAIAFDTTQITSDKNYSQPRAGDPCHPLAAGAHPPAIAGPMAVRRLTPEECEALQGLPRGYTDVPYRGKPAADGPRYRALGNSFAVPCVRWIGERIQLVEEVAPC